VNAYVINLADRTDRWESVLSQWTANSIPLIRIEAVPSSSILKPQAAFLPPPVIANWSSQCLVYKTFLSTDDEYALVFEDDFLLKNAVLEEYLELVKTADLDFLQLGFLYNSFSDLVSVKITNFRDLFLKFLNWCAGNFTSLSFLHEKMTVREQQQIDFSIVLNDARAGSHAYLISRKFATTMLGINSPVFLAADGLFISISGLRFLKMGRFRKNIIRQSKSPTSITRRFISE
jgi:GR25 family glycosyltransferase involved in LPS biosynthesis